MKNKTYVLNTILTVVVAIALLAVVLVRTFLPQHILPEVSIPNLVALSVIALVIDHYIAKGAKHCYICIPLFALITFGLLPWVCGYAACDQILRIALMGAVTFTVVTFLFSSMQDRLSSGPAAKAAPVISAAGLYLAAQCLVAIF